MIARVDSSLDGNYERDVKQISLKNKSESENMKF